MEAHPERKLCEAGRDGGYARRLDRLEQGRKLQAVTSTEMVDGKKSVQYHEQSFLKVEPPYGTLKCTWLSLQMQAMTSTEMVDGKKSIQQH